MLFYETKKYIHLHQQVIQLNANQYQNNKRILYSRSFTAHKTKKTIFDFLPKFVNQLPLDGVL